MKKVSILLAVLMLVASPLYAFQSDIPDYVSWDDNNTVKVADVEEFSTLGGMMEGMIVTATYQNGDGVEATWVGEIDEYGYAHAKEPHPNSGFREFKLSYTGDTWYDFNWEFAELAKGSLQKLTINALAGNTVFDIYDYEQGLEEDEAPINTLGSRRGYAFELEDPDFADQYDVSVTYKDLVAVGGNDAVGDLYGTLEINFGEKFVAGNGTGSFKFKADTDNIVPIPEPGTVFLLGLGVLGLLGYARKRK